MSPLSGSPAEPLWRELPISRAFLYTYFNVPSKGPPSPSPSRFPSQCSQRERERRSTSRAPFIHLSKSLVNELPFRFPSRTPMKRDAHLQSLFYITFIRLSNPGYISPLPGSPTVPLWTEMCITRHFLYITFRVPSKGNTPPGSPHRAPLKLDALFPELSFNYLSGFPVNRPP